MPTPFPVEIIVTPRFDVFYALHALTSEAPTPLGAWKERASGRLPRGFAPAAKRVAPIPIFWPLLADALRETPGTMTFDEILSTLRSMEDSELRKNVLEGIFHHRPTVDALLIGEKTLRQVLTDERHPDAAILTHFGLRPYSARSAAIGAMSTLLSEPAAYRDDLIGVLRKFWDSGFRADWESLDPTLTRTAARVESLVEKEPFAGVAAKLRLPVLFDEESGALRTKSGALVEARKIERCYVVPSAFNTRRWWAKYESGSSRVTLYFPVWAGAEAANALSTDPEQAARAERTSQARPKINAESVFRALGDTTRYAIASILARNPTSSAELSRILKVSKPTITHHVHALRSAGLITEETGGGSSRLSLNRDTVEALSNAAVRDLFSSTGELQLLTTRHRPGSQKKI
jgi:DNA-binding transcriptional ArsR family regulator